LLLAGRHAPAGGLLLLCHISPTRLRSGLLTPGHLLLVLLAPGRLLAAYAGLLALPIRCAGRRGFAGLLLATSPEEEKGDHSNDERNHESRYGDCDGRAYTRNNGC
jgi:hypothetical protein